MKNEKRQIKKKEKLQANAKGTELRYIWTR